MLMKEIDGTTRTGYQQLSTYVLVSLEPIASSPYPPFLRRLRSLQVRYSVLPMDDADSLVRSPPFIVSQYMPKGDVRCYLARYPNTNRVKLVLFSWSIRSDLTHADAGSR